MKTKKTIAISMATAALVLGKNVNDEAAMCALRDMASEFSNPLISMAGKPMPEDIYAQLHEEVHTTATKRVRKEFPREFVEDVENLFGLECVDYLNEQCYEEWCAMRKK